MWWPCRPRFHPSRWRAGSGTCWAGRRLLHAPVVIRDEIDCLLVDFPQHLHRQRSETCLCVVADEAVGDECVVSSVHTQAVYRLHARVCHRRDPCVVEPAVGEVSGDCRGVGIVSELPQEFADATVYDGFRRNFIRNRSLGTYYRDIAGTNLLDQLPQQCRHADHIDQAQQRVVRRAGDLEALRGAHRVCLMFSGVEQSVGNDGIAVTVNDFELDRVIRIGPRTGANVSDADLRPPEAAPRHRP